MPSLTRHGGKPSYDSVKTQKRRQHSKFTTSYGISSPNLLQPSKGKNSCWAVARVSKLAWELLGKNPQVAVDVDAEMGEVAENEVTKKKRKKKHQTQTSKR